jgi:hypothetical protein
VCYSNFDLGDGRMLVNFQCPFDSVLSGKPRVCQYCVQFHCSVSQKRCFTNGRTLDSMITAKMCEFRLKDLRDEPGISHEEWIPTAFKRLVMSPLGLACFGVVVPALGVEEEDQWSTGLPGLTDFYGHKVTHDVHSCTSWCVDRFDSSRRCLDGQLFVFSSCFWNQFFNNMVYHRL